MQEYSRQQAVSCKHNKWFFQRLDSNQKHELSAIFLNRQQKTEKAMFFSESYTVLLNSEHSINFSERHPYKRAISVD